jgi:excinuclease ABC subunit C
VLVDGGKGQLSAAGAALQAVALRLPVIGLAKRYEHIFLPEQDEPVVLLPSSPVLQLIQRIRDEAHRFAIFAHRRRRDRQISSSALDAVPGIGPVRKQLLLRRLGSVEQIARALPEEIALAGRLPLPTAHAILKHLNLSPPARRT